MSSLAALAIALSACGAPSNPEPRSASSAPAILTPTLTPIGSAPPGRWRRYVAGDDGRRADVYVANDEKLKPVVVLLHGGGLPCPPDFTVESDGNLRETSVFQDAIATSLSRVHFAVVERPGIEPLVFTAGMTDAEKRAAFARAERNCGNEYFMTSTKPNRVADAIAAIRALSQQPWAREILLAGHSEGTLVVTGILRELGNLKITAAGLFASMGPIRYFCGYASRGQGDYERFNRTVEQMQMLQRADDDFIWDGLPARRWKTFWLGSTPIEDVRDSPVPLFVSQGTRDDTTLCSDLFVLEAIRQQPLRPVRYVVVDQGNHAFETPDGRWRVSELFEEFLDWSLDGNRQTHVSVLR